MVGVHLNCQVCGKELRPEPYMDWAIGERGQRAFFCEKSSYSENRGGPPHARLEIVFPELEVFQYELCIENGGKIYQLSACIDTVLPNKKHPVLHVHKVVTSPTDRHSFGRPFSLDRAYPIDVNKDLKEQCQSIMDKVKSLMVFV